MTFLVLNIAFSFCLISLSSCLHYPGMTRAFYLGFVFMELWCGLVFLRQILPEEMVPTVVLLPHGSSVLRFQECLALPGHFLHFSPMYFQLPFSSLSFSFSYLHNLYKYYIMLRFFMDFTSIISSSSPLTFCCMCMPTCVCDCPVCMCLWESEHSLHCRFAAALLLFETGSH